MNPEQKARMAALSLYLRHCPTQPQSFWQFLTQIVWDLRDFRDYLRQREKA